MSLNICRYIGEAHSKAIPGIDLTKLSLPDIKFTKPTPAAIWHKYDFIPASSWHAHGDEGKRYFSGVFQITVFAPAGQGLAKLAVAVDAVMAHFGNTRLVQGAVTLDTSDPIPGPVNQETEWTSIPVSISFETR